MFKECLRACANIFDKSKTKLKPTVTITRNGRFIIHLDWLDTVLADNDNVRILTLH
ncbi:MAG: MoaD/ThiS family protein, partial [Desulfobacteraceae bacterium]|nr:MoaD/ThiS family protein [Desulfobacteraceae bacterium]